MINYKELRIGAHVECNGQRAEVISITIPDKDSQPIIGTNVDCAKLDEIKIEPIPITAALLAESGFEQLRAASGKYKEQWCMERDTHTINITKGLSLLPKHDWTAHISLHTNYYTIGCAGVMYLHQLENFIYLCTGQELIKEEGGDV